MGERLLTTREVSQILGIGEKEIIELCQKGEIPHFKLAGEFLRFKKEDILKNKKYIQKKVQLREVDYSLKEKIKDFFFFNDFYIISGLLIIVLLWIIFK